MNGRHWRPLYIVMTPSCAALADNRFTTRSKRGRYARPKTVAKRRIVGWNVVLGRHQAHDAEGQSVDGKGIAWRHRMLAEEHFAHVVADDRHPRRAILVRLHQEAAAVDGDGADLLVERLHALHGEGSAVVSAGGAGLGFPVRPGVAP